MLIAEVILPLPIKSNFSYTVPDEWKTQAVPGKRVLVAFGKGKIYTGIIKHISNEATSPVSSAYKLRPLEEILDDLPLLPPRQMSMIEWISYYYMCTEGEVIKAAVPTGLKPESVLRIGLPEHMAEIPASTWEQIDDKSFLLLEALSLQPVLTLEEVVAIMGLKNPILRLKKLESQGHIRLYQEVEEGAKPKTRRTLRLSAAYQSSEALEKVFEQLNPKHENLLMFVVSAFFQGKNVPRAEAMKQQGVSPAILNALIKKGYLEEYEKIIERLPDDGLNEPIKEITLNAPQQTALAAIHESFEAYPGKPVLLHGITGSGKTHLYISLMKEAIARGEQVLYLLPEITLTKQIIERVKAEIGPRIGVYHSRFSDSERVEIWQKCLAGAYDVVIGVRSAIFLPLSHVGLMVVDEEHDDSFKQQEPAPRYNARDVAVYMAHKTGAQVILGSATPALETFFNAESGRFTYVNLDQRALAGSLPSLSVIDMRKARKAKAVKGWFSQELLTSIEETLARKEQVILFQNRRGYSPFLICENCGHVPQCIHCDISLTFHKEKNHLRCHYCGYTDFKLTPCTVCNHHTMKQQGAGTERLEEEVSLHFPNHKVARMDFDTTRGKHKFRQLIQLMEEGQVDILVGTQMVSKGLDFDRVTLVGVVNADSLLNYPDFRAFERAYQVLLQVGGRSGRRNMPGKVLIQTYDPENPVLEKLQLPFREFYRMEVKNREDWFYPPFSRLIRIEIRHSEQAHLEQEAIRMGQVLRPALGKSLLGPDYAMIARARNQYRMQFLIKVHRSQDPRKLRTLLEKLISTYREVAPPKAVRILIDVDPV